MDLQADDTSRKPASDAGFGLFGGVFDPVHSAHRAVALAALEQLPIREVLFVPAGDPPHKSGHALAPAEHRLRMLELALGGDPRLRIDDRELRRPGASYTVLTLEELRRERPEERIYLLIGADNARSIGRWHRAEEILDLAEPVIVPRPGHENHFTAEDLPGVPAERRAAWNRIALTGVSLEHASRTIRARVREGRSLEGWVPEEVAEYIAEQGLYRD